MNQSVDLEVLSQAKPYVDKKRRLWMLGIVVPNIANTVLLGYQFGPKSTKKLFAFAGPLVLHVIIPSIDKMMGVDPDNPPEQAIADLEDDPYYARVVKLFIPFQYAANIYGLYLASKKSTPLVDQIGIGHMLGVVNGVAINTAHELSHKPGKLEHYLSHLALAPTGYNHFRIEHPYGHHRRVATPEDPASSQMGETFWQFWPRTVIGSFKSAIEIETRRLERKGKKFWSFDNELLQGWGMSAAYHALTLKMFGTRILPTQIAQALQGITLFEAVNYMEHYGLVRVPGTPVALHHSWNTNKLVSSLLLYNLTRHSHHHEQGSLEFWKLRPKANAPEMPYGYLSTLYLVVFFPWLYRRMMEPKLEHWLNHYATEDERKLVLASN